MKSIIDEILLESFLDKHGERIYIGDEVKHSADPNMVFEVVSIDKYNSFITALPTRIKVSRIGWVKAESSRDSTYTMKYLSKFKE